MVNYASVPYSKINTDKDDLGMISESQHYIRNLIKFKKYTPKGLLYLEEWGSLRLAANTAYLALVTAKLDPDSSDDLLQFAKEWLFILILKALPVFI